MVEYQYTFMLAFLIFLVIWFILFIWRKDLRKEMLIISVLFGIIGPFSELIYTVDWWSPLFLFGFTSAGVEDILFGFACGGVSAVIYVIYMIVYKHLFKKRSRIYEISKTPEAEKDLNFVFIISLAGILFLVSFFILNNSFYATIISLFIPTLIIWIKRKDLILNSLVTGVFLLLVVVLIYSILEFLTPGWVSAFWQFKNVPPIIILNVPIDDIIWYFLAGLFIGPLYEYWKGKKLVYF